MTGKDGEITYLRHKDSGKNREQASEQVITKEKIPRRAKERSKKQRDEGSR